MTWQDWVAMLMVASAGLMVACRTYFALFGGAIGSCSSCGSCSRASSRNMQPQLLSIGPPVAPK
jgi:hypothetical protein